MDQNTSSPPFSHGDISDDRGAWCSNVRSGFTDEGDRDGGGQVIGGDNLEDGTRLGSTGDRSGSSRRRQKWV